MNYTALFSRIAEHCHVGESADVDYVLNLLGPEVDLPTTRAVDYYLFIGIRIQRNYCTLFFARRNDWEIVNRAYNEGLIDRIQAYSR